MSEKSDGNFGSDRINYKKLFWENYCPLLLTVVVALVGYCHVENTAILEKRKDHKVRFLEESYKILTKLVLEEISMIHPKDPTFREFQKAQIYLELYGNTETRKSLHNVLDSIVNYVNFEKERYNKTKNKNEYKYIPMLLDVHPVLESIRKEIISELELDEIEEPLYILNINMLNINRPRGPDH